MYSPKFTSALLVFLLIPFCLRLMRYEPYPAVLFPSGPQTIKKVQGTVEVTINQLYAQHLNGAWQRVEPKTFMYPAPAPYLTNLITKEMGFKEAKAKPFNGKYAVINYLFRSQTKEPTVTEMNELRNWLKDRLTKNNYKTSQIKIATYTQTISTANGEILKSELKNEEFYNLD